MLARALRTIGRRVDRLLLAVVRLRIGGDVNAPLADRVLDVLEAIGRKQYHRLNKENESLRARRSLHAVR